MNGGAAISSFTIQADKFQIQLPGYNGNAPYPFFTTGLVAGVASVGISGSMYLDGTLNARAIVTGSITSASGAIGALSLKSLSLADNAVTVPVAQSVGGTLTGNNTNQNIFSFNLSVDTTGLSGKVIPIYVTTTLFATQIPVADIVFVELDSEHQQQRRRVLHRDQHQRLQHQHPDRIGQYSPEPAALTVPVSVTVQRQQQLDGHIGHDLCDGGRSDEHSLFDPDGRDHVVGHRRLRRRPGQSLPGLQGDAWFPLQEISSKTAQDRSGKARSLVNPMKRRPRNMTASPVGSG